MPGPLQSLAWGVLFNVFYVSLISVVTTIFRSSTPLSAPVAFVFLFLGETLGTLPLFPVARRNWTVKTRRRLAAFFVLGFVINANFLAWRAASELMPLGTYAALSCYGFILTPAVTAVLHRRCVGVVDAGGIVAALVGLLLITHPTLLFDEPVVAPAYAYFLAAFNGFNSLILPYFFGATSEEHWSNFLVLRLICGAVVAMFCFGVAGGPSAFSAPNPTASAGVVLVGVVSTIYRLAQQVGCYELETFDPGLAGLLGNVILAGEIPTTTLLSLTFFGESLSKMETIGVSMTFCAIVVVSLAKGCEKDVIEREV